MHYTVIKFPILQLHIGPVTNPSKALNSPPTSLLILALLCVKPSTDSHPSESHTFFFLRSQQIKKRKGAQPLVHWKYTKGLRGRGEEIEKIRKTNHLWGQPPCSPSEKSKKEQMEKESHTYPSLYS